MTIRFNVPSRAYEQKPCLQGKFRDQSCVLVVSFFGGLTKSASVHFTHLTCALICMALGVGDITFEMTR